MNILIKYTILTNSVQFRFNLSPFTKDYRDLGLYVNLLFFVAISAFLINKEKYLHQ